PTVGVEPPSAKAVVRRERYRFARAGMPEAPRAHERSLRDELRRSRRHVRHAAMRLVIGGDHLELLRGPKPNGVTGHDVDAARTCVHRVREVCPAIEAAESVLGE